MRALLLLCTVAIVMASVINLTSARYMPQGYNARAPARSMEENANAQLTSARYMPQGYNPRSLAHSMEENANAGIITLI